MHVSLIRCACVALGVSLAVVGLSAHAQQLDPSMLRQLQERAQQAQGQSQSPVDAARQAEAGQASGQRTLDSRTSAERERDDALARRALVAAYEPTPIERDYRLRSGDSQLRQFGYDLFRAAQAPTGPISGRVGDDYVMGIGDEVVIVFQGPTPRNITTRVDREGRLIIDQLRPVQAAGRTLGAVRRDIEALTRASMLGTEAFVSVGGIRSVTVVVGGEVMTPGQLSLTSMADVITALARAGGVRPTGSLRRVRIERDGRIMTLDLYGLLGIGRSETIRLRDGDRVIVPAIGPVIAITGGVARPGIYELSGDRAVSLTQALAFAGGPLRPQGNEMVVSRIERNGAERILQLTEAGGQLRAGDILMVNPREAGTVGRVTLSGFVDSPGLRSLANAPSVRALLGRPENVRLGAYLPFAVLVRADPVTRAAVYVPVNLVEALGRGPDVPLRNDDELVILSRTAIDYLRSTDVRRIILGDDSDIRDCRALRHLSALVRDTQGSRFAAAVRGNFVVADRGRVTIGDRAAVQANTTGRAATDEAQQAVLMQQAATDNQREERAETAGGCIEAFESRPSLLPFLLEHTAVAVGALRDPGAYPIVPGTDLQTLISVAGGFVANAESESAELSRIDSPDAQRTSLSLSQGRAEAIQLRPGDEVRFAAKPTPFELGAVLLSGEVVRPGLYPIRRGETLNQLVARAGGYTQSAFPFGAVFTRRSVKQAQQEGFQRTARELTQSLLAVTARKNNSSDALVAAANLARDLERTEATGRMVIEADVRVLEQRPDLDTVLEPGDSLFVPKRPNYVLSVGDVLNPGALTFIPNKSVQSYLAESGGLQSSADTKRVFVVLPNGVAQPVNRSAWRRSQVAVPPGSVIVTPKNIDPLKTLDLVRDVSAIISQFAVSIASIAVISSNN
jgi:polysaccharide biosynthesis/export protein